MENPIDELEQTIALNVYLLKTLTDKNYAARILQDLLEELTKDDTPVVSPETND